MAPAQLAADAGTAPITALAALIGIRRTMGAACEHTRAAARMRTVALVLLAAALAPARTSQVRGWWRGCA